MLDATTHARAADLFLRATEAAPEAREAVLREEADPTVASAARALLHGHLDTTGPLDAPLVRRGADGADRRIGHRVGPWRLDAVLGHGGMGVVYRATRDDDAYEREVALKLLHPGPDHRRLAERLESERRILARLEHPGIARLYDGGLTSDGLPYLAMELVRGESITEHADARGLRVDARVQLVAEVCDAVAYAHRRLVVHRDLKPSNILVASGEEREEARAKGQGGRERGTAPEATSCASDESPRPPSPIPHPSRAARVKLLDFGLAKLLDAENDGLTRTQAILTPSYAAPEQITGDEITTATDVYALGILLYEMLAGDRPYHLSGTTAAEAERIVCHDVPPPPSTIAPEARRKALRGDLDTIVMTALAKEPERRYPSAEALAADLRRHLRGLPIDARPATARYRASRFVQRHRLGVAATALIALALLGGTGIALWQAQEARAERRTADRVNAFVTDMLASASPYEGGRRDVTILQAADAAASRLGDLDGEPETEAGIRLALGATYRGVGAYDKAERHLARALDLRQRLYGPRHPQTADAYDALGALHLERSEYEAADSLFALSLSVRQRHPGEHRLDYATTRSRQGQVALQTGDLDGAVDALREAIALYRRAPEPWASGVREADANARYTLGLALHERGDYSEADSVLTPLAGEMRRARGRAPSTLGSVLSTLAWNHDYLGQPDQIEPLLREALAFREERFGETHAEVGYALNDLAYYYQFQANDLPRAETAYRRALAIFRQAHGDDYAAVPAVLNNLGSLYRGSGRAPEAVPVLQEAIAIQRELLGDEHVDVSYPLINLGRTYVVLGQPARAEAPLREALRLRRQSDGDVHRRVAVALEALATAVRASGDLDGAIDLFREAADVSREALGPDQAETAEAEVALARALLARGASGDRADADRLAARAAPLLREALPDGGEPIDALDALEAALGR